MARKKVEETELIDMQSRIHDYTLEDIMGERFGRYSKYIIQDRAIPDVRDGLKPVQRRIIYAMHLDKNTHDKPFKKCANAVGNVLGKFHPHGDTSVYDALIHLSQEWKNNNPLVEVDGNNGSIDGDPPAAMRYTETRLSKIAEETLKDLPKDTVVWAPNYSDTLMEPTVLPAKFPTILVNGTMGISAGYATNIPTHNLGEIIDATIKRIDSPNCHLDSILDIVKGPDFPTGGIVEGKDDIRQALETGKGKVSVRAKYEFVKDKNKESCVITEIPFDVVKQQLVKKIDDIRINNSVSGIAEVRDESDKDAFCRIVIDFKPGANKELVMNYLLKNTDLKVNCSYNMVTIVNRRPRQLGILGILDAYIAFDKEVVRKRSEYDLKKAEEAANLALGMLKAVDILDKIIKTIRASKGKADAKKNIMAEYGFNDAQAEYIVTLQLYRLANTEVEAEQAKYDNAMKIITMLKEILEDESKLNQVLKNELRAIKKEYATPRKTEISDEVKEISYNAEDLIMKEQVIVSLSKDGYLKKVSSKSYNSADSAGVKEGDYLINLYETTTLNKIMVLTKKGNYIYIPINDIPMFKWKDLGKHVSNFVAIDPNDEVVKAYVVDDRSHDMEVVIYTKDGMVKKISLNDLTVSKYNKLYTYIKLKDDDQVVDVQRAKENTIIVSKSGYYISYKTDEIPTVASGKSAGVKGINLKDDEVVSGLTYDSDDEYLNIFTNQKTGKRVKLTDLTESSRAKRGSMVIKPVKSTNYEIISALITSTKDMIGLSKLDDVEELKNTDISIMDLASTGSNITKSRYTKAFVITTLKKVDEVEKETKPKEVKKTKAEAKQEELEFIDDFKI
ncbi:MAG: DNA topoisomerase IV subunit A [Bacilli bacterium]|nr:DNA topoisomerase IV subunit A [Bacilli bacterium]